MKISYWYSIFYCLCFAFIFSNSVVAQESKLYSVDKVKKDYEIAISYIEAHPDPYTHISQEDFETFTRQVLASFTQPISELEFYKSVASTIALIKDGHSSVYPPENWLLDKRKEYGAFPYECYLSNDDELYIIESYNDGPIPIKSKIELINGITVDSFLNLIDPYISYELKHFRNTKIDNSIELYLYLAFGYSHDTEIQYFNTEKQTITVSNMEYKSYKSYMKENKEERDILMSKGKPYKYEKIADGVGKLTLFAFSANSLKAYDFFLHETFKEISNQEIHSLIIDVRENFGGWPKISSRLFHYISETHFKTQARSALKVSQTYRNYLREKIPYLRDNKPFINTDLYYIDINSIMRNEIGSYVNQEIFFNESPITREYEFTGDCYVLTNRDSYSAASSFAATFQCYQMGIIVGNETGGTKIFRANAIFQRLIRTGVGVGMSTVKNFNTCYNEEMEGVVPTVEYEPTVLDLTSGMDMQVLYTQRLIKKMQKQKATAEQDK